MLNIDVHLYIKDGDYMNSHTVVFNKQSQVTELFCKENNVFL
jgi:hypothetical protein